MSPLLKNVLAVIAGLAVGSIVNMAIVNGGMALIPPPEGADLTTAEGYEAAMEMLTPKHFIMPFLAHALGTLTGAIVAAKLAANNKAKFALGIGALFLLGGIAASFMIPAPKWFIAMDLLLAYLPMAWLGGRLAGANAA